MAAANIPIGLSKTQREKVSKHFNMLAFSDFHHDFKTSYLNDLLKSVPISTANSYKFTKNIATIRSQITPAIGRKRVAAAGRYMSKNINNWNLYDELSDMMLKIVPDVEERDVANLWRAEEDVIQAYGINFAEIKSSLTARTAANILEPISSPNIQIKIPDNTEDAEGILLRTYSIRAMPYKINGKHIPLGVVFEKATGKTKFTMVIDAGNIPFSELKKIRNIPDDSRADRIDMMEFNAEQLALLGFENVNEMNKAYEFTILESIENKSDSAVKTETFKRYDESLVKVRRMTDTGHSSSFPNFNVNNDAQNANFFSSIDFITKRTDPSTVKGIYTLAEGATVFLDDLGHISQIGNASSLTTMKYVENYGSKDILDIQSVILHPTSKRQGDWSQGLCLLDDKREYEDVEVRAAAGGGQKGGGITLKEFPDSAIGIMTHDQILLAYCLLIGINVFFTMKTVVGDMRVSWLLYFENNESAAEIELSKKQIDELKETLEDIKIEIDGDGNPELITGIIPICNSYEKDLRERLAQLLNTALTVTDFKNYIYDYYFNFDLYDSIVSVNKSLSNSTIPSLQAELEGAVVGYKVKMKIDSLAQSIKLINDNIEIINQRITAKNLRKYEGSGSIIDDVQSDILSGKNIATCNSYKSLKSMIFLIIQKGIQRFIESNPDINPIAPTDFKLEEYFVNLGKRRRIANLSENLKIIRRDIEEIFYAATVMADQPQGVMSGGMRFIPSLFKDQVFQSFSSIRQNQILLLSVGDAAVNPLRTIQAKNEKYYDTFHYVAPKYGFIIDTNGDYYSVIDEFIVTKNDCYKFINIFGFECDIVNADSFSKYYTNIQSRFNLKRREERSKRIRDTLEKEVKNTETAPELRAAIETLQGEITDFDTERRSILSLVQSIPNIKIIQKFLSLEKYLNRYGRIKVNTPSLKDLENEIQSKQETLKKIFQQRKGQEGLINCTNDKKLKDKRRERLISMIDSYSDIEQEIQILEEMKRILEGSPRLDISKYKSILQEQLSPLEIELAKKRDSLSNTEKRLQILNREFKYQLAKKTRSAYKKNLRINEASRKTHNDAIQKTFEKAIPSLEGSDGPMYEYIQLKWYLLLHDILYTKLQTLKAREGESIEDITLEGVEYSSRFQTELNMFVSDTDILIKYLVSINYRYSVRLDFSEAPMIGNIYFLIQRLARIRNGLFELYYTHFKFHEKFPITLDEEQKNELALFTENFSYETEQSDSIEIDYELLMNDKTISEINLESILKIINSVGDSEIILTATYWITKIFNEQVFFRENYIFNNIIYDMLLNYESSDILISIFMEVTPEIGASILTVPMLRINSSVEELRLPFNEYFNELIRNLYTYSNDKQIKDTSLATQGFLFYLGFFNLCMRFFNNDRIDPTEILSMTTQFRGYLNRKGLPIQAAPLIVNTSTGLEKDTLSMQSAFSLTSGTSTPSSSQEKGAPDSPSRFRRKEENISTPVKKRIYTLSPQRKAGFSSGARGRENGSGAGSNSLSFSNAEQEGTAASAAAAVAAATAATRAAQARQAKEAPAAAGSGSGSGVKRRGGAYSVIQKSYKKFRKTRKRKHTKKRKTRSRK
jgi:hypothetical protein